MKSSERVQYWTAQVEAQRASALTIADWCKEQGVSRNSFCGWRTRLNKSVAMESGWVSVSVPVPAPRSLVVKVSSASIEVASGFDAALLASVVRALSE